MSFLSRTRTLDRIPSWPLSGAPSCAEEIGVVGLSKRVETVTIEN